MTALFLLTVVLAAPDAGAPSPSRGLAARPADEGARTGFTNGGVPGRRSADSGQAPAPPGDGAGPTAVDGAPEPSTNLSVQEPATSEGAPARAKKARADRSDGQSDPTGEALLEQSRLQTQALQQIAAQQQAAVEVRYAQQQARAQRGLRVESARGSINSTVNSLQTTGDWDADALQSTRMSLQQTAAAASAAGSPAEASRAADAASLIRAAEAALAQRNAQQAQYYLLQANQLLQGGYTGRSGY